MNLASEYGRQFGWRDWVTVLDALPSLVNQTVLDLGCAMGDQAAVMTERGARVIGVDADAELLREAHAKHIPNARFLNADLRQPFESEAVDGIWCSFVSAYFPSLRDVLRLWTQHLRPDGWIALTEIDDLFGHEPLSVRSRSLLDAYSQQALEQGRYDFRMGSKLEAYLQECGLSISKVLTLNDQELCFAGPAAPDVLQAWRHRFDRMTG
ncbi:MAG TPA: methyltransferase domain-containing protein, partial [Polyangiaceae bacterium]|nr:methyltransferase domain-containing protein [Polyangiaceae bacterium]